MKAPFPWFGGKKQAAPLVWALLGDPCHYVEPFCGSMAVLLERPHPCNRTYHSETVCDADGCLVNAWRAIQFCPEETARWASWPVTEYDKQARHIAFQKWRTTRAHEMLAGSWDWCDPRIAGFWLYGICCQIGGVKGPWTADPRTGRIRRIKDIEADPEGAEPMVEFGVPADRPHLGDADRGVNRPQLRESGVRANLPHLSANGMGVNNAGLREPGVSADRPHLGNAGRGVNHANLREPGVPADRPHVSDNGMGVNRPQLREPGVLAESQTEFHAMTMPGLLRWFALLAARLRHVRIVNGDWQRVCTTGATKTIDVRQGDKKCGIFFDPPYDSEERSAGLYHSLLDDGSVATTVREWCLRHGSDPDYRIVLAGYDTEHIELEEHGWSAHEWFKGGYLTGGYGNIAVGFNTGDHQQRRERLWSSPHCLAQDAAPRQRKMW